MSAEPYVPQQAREALDAWAKSSMPEVERFWSVHRCPEWGNDRLLIAVVVALRLARRDALHGPTQINILEVIDGEKPIKAAWLTKFDAVAAARLADEVARRIKQTRAPTCEI